MQNGAFCIQERVAIVAVASNSSLCGAFNINVVHRVQELVAECKSLGDKAVKVEEQDYNDLNKAFLWLRENCPEATEIHILGAAGRSEAHALGNLSYLMFWESRYGLSSAGINVDMVSDYNTAFAISDSCELHVGEGRKVSLFSSDTTLRIKSAGLEWPTDDVKFDYWFRATLNRAVNDVISLQFSHPAPALIILD